MKVRNAMSAMTLAGLAATASAQPTITEIYNGLPGNDGTADWFEITNLTGATLTYAAGDLLYDDESADFSVADPFPAFTLLDGESLVVLLDENIDTDPANGVADAIDEFETVWGSGIATVTVDGSGLGQGGDAVTLFDAAGTILDSAAYVAEDDSAGPVNPLLQLQTWDILNGGRSQLGIDGAFQSNAFDNDSGTFGPPDTPVSVQLIGSPGVAIPEPATAAALVLLSGLALRRRSA
ncbi:MAG: PEP-CTERM sorting domain-containing protein [Planctomycetota bacterium]